MDDATNDIVLCTVKSSPAKRAYVGEGAGQSVRWGTAVFGVTEVWRSQHLKVGDELQSRFYCTSGGRARPGGWIPCPARDKQLLVGVRWEGQHQKPAVAVVDEGGDARLAVYRECWALRTGSGMAEST